MLNRLKNIAFIVELDGEDPKSTLGEHAARLARSQEAHLIGIYAIDTAPGIRSTATW